MEDTSGEGVLQLSVSVLYKKECYKLRHLTQRLNEQEVACSTMTECRPAKRSKSHLWRIGYKLVNGKIRVMQNPCLLKAEKMDRIVRAAFPSYPTQVDDSIMKDTEDYPFFSIKSWKRQPSL